MDEKPTGANNSIVTMRRLYIILILTVLIQCQTEVDSLNGHYISATEFSEERYETLDIVDSLVFINRIVMGSDERDTIVIEPRTKKFVRVIPKGAMFPIVDFMVVGDTIEVHFEHDLGQGKIKFIKITKSNSAE